MKLIFYWRVTEREGAGIDQPQAVARALFETSAAVLTGLIKAFEDYEKKNEAAWQ